MVQGFGGNPYYGGFGDLTAFDPLEYLRRRGLLADQSIPTTPVIPTPSSGGDDYRDPFPQGSGDGVDWNSLDEYEKEYMSATQAAQPIGVMGFVPGVGALLGANQLYNGINPLADPINAGASFLSGEPNTHVVDRYMSGYEGPGSVTADQLGLTGQQRDYFIDQNVIGKDATLNPMFKDVFEEIEWQDEVNNQYEWTDPTQKEEDKNVVDTTIANLGYMTPSQMQSIGKFGDMPTSNPNQDLYNSQQNYGWGDTTSPYSGNAPQGWGGQGLSQTLSTFGGGQQNLNTVANDIPMSVDEALQMGVPFGTEGDTTWTDGQNVFHSSDYNWNNPTMTGGGTSTSGGTTSGGSSSSSSSSSGGGWSSSSYGGGDDGGYSDAQAEADAGW